MQYQIPPSANPDLRIPVSVIIPVKNEAENLTRCLPALAWADQVFVVDSQSSDQTAEVAASFGAEVVQFHFNGKYPKKKNWALDNLPFRNDWVMIVDADEVVVPELAHEIGDRIARGEADGYYLNSRYYFLGRHIRHCGYSSCWNLRLFIHRLGRYEKIPDGTGGRAGDNEAHEHVELDGRVLRLEHELEHHAYPTVAVWVEKHNRYAIWEAALADRVKNEPIPKTIGGAQRFKRRLKKIAWRLPMRPLVRFLYAYVLRLGFLDGKPGLYFCGLLAFYDFLALANRYEMRLTEGNARRGPPLLSPPCEGGERKRGTVAVFPSSAQADVFALVEVDVCAADVPGSPLPALVEDDVVVDVCAPAVPDPEPSLVEFVDDEVDVEACAAGAVEPD